MIEFVHTELSAEYAKYWNESSKDFLTVYKDGKKLRETLYRKGGLGGEWKDGLMCIIKHKEDFYRDEITTDKKRKPHLSGEWCVLNEDGEEKFVAEKHSYIHLHGGLIFSNKDNFYNIETKECYGRTTGALDTEEYLFINNWGYKVPKEKEGILQVNKYTGATKFFPKKMPQKKIINI